MSSQAYRLDLPRKRPSYGGAAVKKKNVLSGLPPNGRCFKDDPRAVVEISRLPAAQPGNVTAAFCGDPAPGRSAA